jgi:hypothetical protein
MKALLCLSLVAVLAFAGCTSKSDSSSSTGTGTDTASGAASGTATGSGTTSHAGTSTGVGATGTTSAAPGANAAPAIHAFTANKTAGTTPLKVAFTLNATDADKDAITYVLSFGDGSANKTGSLPAPSVDHTYLTKGNFTARLVVSDGKLASNKTLALKVTAPAATAPSGNPVTWQGYGVGTPAGCFTTDSDGNAYLDFDPAIAGVWHFSATSTVPGASIVTEWWAGDNHVADLGATGVIPAGADNLAVCGGIPTLAIDFTLTLAP